MFFFINYPFEMEQVIRDTYLDISGLGMYLISMFLVYLGNWVIFRSFGNTGYHFLKKSRNIWEYLKIFRASILRFPVLVFFNFTSFLGNRREGGRDWMLGGALLWRKQITMVVLQDPPPKKKITGT